VLEPANTNSVFERGYVKALVIRDRNSKRTFGIDFSTFRPAPRASGWPPGTFLGELGEPTTYCIPALATDGGR
jgi:hypothetical protein